MPTTTTNYGLIKPDTTDPILIGQLNDNSDAIDAALKENADAIENKPDAADIPTPSTTAPAMDGTAAAGTSTDYARADHVHPSDTSKQDLLTTSQLAAVNSGIDSEKVAQYDSTTELEAKDRAALVELVDGGAKNLINITPETKSVGSITFTANTDGTVDVSGITNSTVTYMLLGTSTDQETGMVEIPVGKYYISGGLASTTNVSVSVYINGSSSPNRRYYHAFATAREFEINSGDKVAIAIRVAASNETGKTYPMLCTKAAWDTSHEYQPYRPSYQELYEMVKALQAAT